MPTLTTIDTACGIIEEKEVTDDDLLRHHHGRVGGHCRRARSTKEVPGRLTRRLPNDWELAPGWFSTPSTVEGWCAAGFASFALALGVLGEAARRGGVSGPIYSLAFVLGLVGGVAAILAVRRGERSLLTMLAFLPLLLGVGFGLAESLG